MPPSSSGQRHSCFPPSYAAPDGLSTAPLLLVQLYAAHFRHLDFFPVWSSSDAYGLGSPVLLYYNRAFFYLAGLIYVLMGGLKLSVVGTVAIFLAIGAYGMRRALGVVTNSRLLCAVGSVGFLFTNYVFTDWLWPRGDLAEFSALMIVPWLPYWCSASGQRSENVDRSEHGVGDLALHLPQRDDAADDLDDRRTRPACRIEGLLGHDLDGGRPRSRDVGPAVERRARRDGHPDRRAGGAHRLPGDRDQLRGEGDARWLHRSAARRGAPAGVGERAPARLGVEDDRHVAGAQRRAPCLSRAAGSPGDPDPGQAVVVARQER